MNGNYLPARIIQAIGLALLIAQVVLWALTGRESALLVSAAMTLILLGAYGSLAVTLQNKSTKITPSPPSETPNGG